MNFCYDWSWCGSSFIGHENFSHLPSQYFSFTQAHYIQTKLELFGVVFSKPMATPFEVNLHLSKDHAPHSVVEIDIMHVVPYQQVVGFFTYAMVCTHPDLAFAMGAVSHHSSNPRPTH